MSAVTFFLFQVLLSTVFLSVIVVTVLLIGVFIQDVIKGIRSIRRDRDGS